jgi:plasmid stabilization system protein ParE
MVTEINWSENATVQTKNIINFLRTHFSESTVEKFKENLEKKLLFVAANPFTGRKTKNKKTIRFSNFGKNYSVYYRINGSKMFISGVFDNRQNPIKRPF